MTYYIPITVYQHTIPLGLFDTEEKAKDAFIKYLKYHEKFDIFYEKFSKIYQKKQNNKLTLDELKKVIFREEKDDTFNEIYDELSEILNDKFNIGCDIYKLSKDEPTDLITMIISYTGWVYLEELIHYMVGYAEEYHIDTLKDIAKKYKLIF